MTATKIGDWPAGSPEWHEARRYRVGGSEIGTVYGLNHFEDAESLAARKRGELEARPDTAAMVRGRYLEPAVLAWLSDTERVTYDPDYEGTWADDWMLYNPDAVTTDGRLVEVKTAGEKTVDRGWGRAGTDQIPLPYQAQCVWGLGILGLTDCLVGVCFGAPFEFRRYRVKFNQRTFDALRVAGERFIKDLGRRAA